MGKSDIYALYHGDTFIDVGTWAEIAKRQGIAIRTIMFYSTPTFKKRTKNEDNHYICFKLEDD